MTAAAAYLMALLIVVVLIGALAWVAKRTGQLTARAIGLGMLGVAGSFYVTSVGLELDPTVSPGSGMALRLVAGAILLLILFFGALLYHTDRTLGREVKTVAVPAGYVTRAH